MMKGFFVTIEGPDGSGKTTQIELLTRYLAAKDLDYIVTREPGGTRIGNRIREILLEKDYTEMTAETETLLYAASRAQHVAEVILPALKKGKIVLCDRFIDASMAYQGMGRGIDIECIRKINSIAVMGIMPHLTILLDIPPSIGLKRKKSHKEIDRIESEELEFHERVREGYLYLAKKEPKRIKVLDGCRDKKVIYSEIVSLVENLLKGGV
ncbi:MAG TPA: dTMP kinase [Thermoanaerobacterales bacterium]|nr:dTMP kinase [Thermoanaerobacterales bacterium]